MHTKIDTNLIDKTKHLVIFVERHQVIIDLEDSKLFGKYDWLIWQSLQHKYVARYLKPGKSNYLVFFHRIIKNCPHDKCVHHINFCSLDNRKENLSIMDIKAHHRLHNRTNRPPRNT